MTNISKQIWSRATWRTIHSFAAGSDSTEKRLYFKQWISILAKLLPCEQCSYHFPLLLRKIPIDNYMDSNVKLLEWTVRIHNDVNERLGYPKFSIHDALLFYLDGSTCDESCPISKEKKMNKNSSVYH